MKKKSAMILVVLSFAVLVFSTTVFAGQNGSTQGKAISGSKAEKTEEKPGPKFMHGTGAYKEDGMFRFYKNGVFKKITGAAFCPEDGTYRYVENGIFSPKTGIVKRLSDGKPVYVKKGLFTKATGVAKRLTDGTWLFVKKGVFHKTTGIVKKADRKNIQVYVKNGIYKKKTGLVQDQKKQWVLLKKGIVVTEPKQFFLTAADERAGRGEILCEVYAKCLYRKIITDPRLSRREKLLKCFYYVESPKHYRYMMNRIPYYTEADWPVVNTLDMILDGGSTCFGYNALFGYLAKLCGYKDVYFCCTRTHGWAEINGLVFDLVFLEPPHSQLVFETTYEEAAAMGLGHYYVDILRRTRVPDFK